MTKSGIFKPRLFLLAVVLAAAPLSPLRGQPAELLRRPQHFERSRDYDALHYRLALVFDDKDKSYTGENGITFASLKDGLEKVSFDAEELTVTSVTDRAGRTLAFTREPKSLTVTLPQSLAWGEQAQLTVKFNGKNPRAGLKFIAADSGRPAQINTYSWPEDAHHWFPCFDDPIDKVTSEVIATVRSDFKVLSNGRLVDVVDNPGGKTKTWHWLQDKPHPTYCIMLAAGPFEVLKDSLGPLPVDYWVYRKDVADAPRSFQKTPRMIDFYSTTFSVPYPWAKYDQVCVAGYGGGMEATTATILGDDTIHDARADQDFSSDGLVAHELAHMWWGDLVTERSWRDVWLSESFATYAEYLFTRSDRGEDEGALNLEEKKKSYLREAGSRYIRPIVFDRYNVPWDIMDEHSYPKGAAVLHMLRFILGEKPFFRTLAGFLGKFAFKNADTHDFMNAVKDFTGENLDWFFELWLYRPGHPVFDVSYVWNEAEGKIKLDVRQVQDFSKGVPVFRTPVLISIRDDGPEVVHKVWITGEKESFEFPSPRKPRLVRFDAGNYLLKEIRFVKSVEELVFQLRSDDAVGRMAAATDLAGHIDEPGVAAALAEASEKDAFWAVRRAALEALPAAGRPELEGLFRTSAADPNSRVRAAAVRALGLARKSELATFFHGVFAKESSYVVQAEALSAIGLCGGKNEVPFLRKAAAMPSPRDILRRSAETAIRAVQASEGNNPKVEIRTEIGAITVEVFAAKAPVTSANFLRYVDNGLYDGTTFFRTVTRSNQPDDTVRIEVIQGGEVDEAKSFPAIAHEATRITGLRHLDGAVSMARAKPGTATSSFFICINDQPELDFGGRRNPDGQGFAAFGKVVAGMAVVRAIQARPANDQRLEPTVKILSVRRIGNGTRH